MSYSIDLRERALSFIEKEGSITEAMRVFNVARTTLNRWMVKKKNGESLKDPAPKRPWKKIDPEVLLDLVKRHPDWDLIEYGKEIGGSGNSMRSAVALAKA